ncbi:MAG: nitrate ABC transporter, partial [Hyphomicrobiales bacterium]
MTSQSSANPLTLYKNIPPKWRQPLLWIAVIITIIGVFLPFGYIADKGSDVLAPLRSPSALSIFTIGAAFASVRFQNWLGDVVLLFISSFVVGLLLAFLPAFVGEASWGFWLLLIACWLLAWQAVTRLSAHKLRSPAQNWLNLLIPVIFGVWILCLWQAIVVGAGVPFVLIPPPSQIGMRIAGSLPTLWADFQQTFLLGVIPGFIIGCGSGFLVAVLVDKVPFLRRGLLPVGNLASALPIVGMAPIMVMWFGFGPGSKIAVVVVMIFFPMLVNTVAGFAAAGAMERDLMRTYAANYGQTLTKLRLPTAMPFIFNALKINSTLA